MVESLLNIKYYSLPTYKRLPWYEYSTILHIVIFTGFLDLIRLSIFKGKKTKLFCAGYFRISLLITIYILPSMYYAFRPRKKKADDTALLIYIFLIFNFFSSSFFRFLWFFSLFFVFCYVKKKGFTKWPGYY